MKLWYKTGDVEALRGLPRHRAVCADVETTGLDPRIDEVLQIALVRGDGEVLLSCYVSPERHLSWPSAERTHGISPLMVKNRPPLTSLKQEIESVFEDADLIVGYNVTFDLSFLQAAGVSIGRAPAFDVMREFAPVAGRWDSYRKRYGWVSLAHCARFYGISLRAHDACEDARATLGCFWAMLERGSGREGYAPSRSYLDVVARYSRDKAYRRGGQNG